MTRRAISFLFVSSVAVCVAVGDEVTLTNGASLLGEWVDESSATPDTQRPDGLRHFRSEYGIRIKVAGSQISSTSREPSAGAIYRANAPRIADNPSAHWKLAEWCRERQRRRHLQRVIELEPGHAQARRALGFSEIDGRWVTQRQIQIENGYLYYRGRWQLPQKIELLEARERTKETEHQWMVDLRRWREQLETEDARAAFQKILAITDVRAIRALENLLRRDRNRRARLLYLEVLGSIRDDRATKVLIDILLTDRDEEVFHASVDHIVLRSTPILVKQFSRLLQSTDNRHVNRAAFTLQRLNDPTAIPSLIEALVTIHVALLPGSRGSTYSFASPSSGQPTGAMSGILSGGTQFSTPRKSQIVSYRQVNQDVLNALGHLVGGASFGYHQEAWRHWYTVHQRQRRMTRTLR